MADFYAARDRIGPPLPWSSIAPPITGGKVYKIIDVLALNFGYAKDKPAEQAGGRFVAN